MHSVIARTTVVLATPDGPLIRTDLICGLTSAHISAFLASFIPYIAENGKKIVLFKDSEDIRPVPPDQELILQMDVFSFYASKPMERFLLHQRLLLPIFPEGQRLP